MGQCQVLHYHQLHIVSDQFRSSPRDKWWSASGDESQASHVGNIHVRSIAVQTDGYVMPYPPESSWIKKKIDPEPPQKQTDILSASQQDDVSSIEREAELANALQSESEVTLAAMIDEMNKSQSIIPQGPVAVGDPLTKKRPSHRSNVKSQHQSSAVVGRGRLAKKVYIDPNSFIRDDDVSDSYSTIETASLFSVSGKSISGSGPNKSKPQSKMSNRRPHPPQDDDRMLSYSADDNSVISNITISPRASER
jgi:hypothetical protein